MQDQMTMDVAMKKEENLKINDLALLHVITPLLEMDIRINET
jgi:hypothetical protein